MVLDPTREFSPTQKEIIKVFPVLESLIYEHSGENSRILKDYKRFMQDIKKEYQWLEKRGRKCYEESTGNTLNEYVKCVTAITRGINDQKILYWYEIFRNYYIKTRDERIKVIINFLKFKHASLIRSTYGDNWIKAPQSPQKVMVASENISV